MTEKEWLTGNNLKKALKYLRRASERKRRLFAVACCGRVLSLLANERAAEILATIERFAEGSATAQALLSAEEGAYAIFEEARETGTEPATLAADALYGAACGGLVRWDIAEYASSNAASAVAAGAPPGKRTAARRDATAAQYMALREIFGNPFRPVAFDPAWRTSDVIALANGIYDERAFDQLPILADALQDAGCDSDDILNHLRDPHATHVRGCWALDLVLGKE